MKTKIVPVVDHKTLERLFSRKGFQEKIREITDIMKVHQREAGFSVYKDISSQKFYIGEINEGCADGISPSVTYDEVPFREYYEITNLHAHDKFLTPSSRDLTQWNFDRNDLSGNYTFDNKKLNIICKKSCKEDIKLFVVQATSHSPLSKTLLEDTLLDIYGKNDSGRYDLNGSKESVNRFNNTGLYRADLLTLHPSGFSENSLKKIKKFEYALSYLKHIRF